MQFVHDNPGRIICSRDGMCLLLVNCREEMRDLYKSGAFECSVFSYSVVSVENT